MVLHVQQIIISVVTAVMLAFGMLPAVAFAEEEPAEEQQTEVVCEIPEEEPVAEEEVPEKEETDNKQAESVKKQVSVNVVISMEDAESDSIDIWFEERTFSAEEGASFKDIIDVIMHETELNFTFDSEGRIESIAGNNESLKTDDTHKWYVKINGGEPEDTVNLQTYKPNNGEAFEFIYAKEIKDEIVEAQEISQDDTVAIMASDNEIAFKYGNTRDYLLKNGDKSGWIYGDEFSVIGNARAGLMTEARKNAYYANLVKELNELGTEKLHNNQSSDNSKVVIALTSIGINPADVEGYNLLQPLSDMNYLLKQGMNGPVWALIAFDCGGYEIPAVSAGGEQVTRDKLVTMILKWQHSDGGWSFSGKSDIDMTGMVIQSLVPYYNKDAKVKAAVDKALLWLSKNQNGKGEFTTGVGASSESQSQVIVALTSLGIDPTKDSRFLKNGKGALDALLSYYVEGGGFKHISREWKANGLATVQGNYALVAYYRFINGQSSLYNITDSKGYEIIIEYNKDNRKPVENTKTEEEQKAEGLSASAGTKALGLISVSGNLSENAVRVVDMIKAVNSAKSPDAVKVTEAYKAYMDLGPAERLAVEKDEAWKTFEKITKKIGDEYHYDKPSGIDLRSNKEEILPWYVKLEPENKKFTEKQEKKIHDILGEGSKIFSSYDIKLTNTLDNSSWEPENVINVKFEADEFDYSLEPVVVHEGKNGRLEFIDTETDRENGTVFFKTTEFSLYGLAGTASDVKTLTGTESVNVMPWCLGAAAALAAVVVMAVIRRKLR